MREEVPPQVSKAVISWFSQSKLSDLSNDNGLQVGLHLIELFNAHRNIALEEEDVKVKREVASIYIAKHNNEQAAKTLEKINLENSSRQDVTPDEKAEIYV